MTLADALVAIERCRFRDGEAGRLRMLTEPGSVTLWVMGAQTGTAYVIVSGRPEDADRLLDEVMALVESWRPPRV